MAAVTPADAADVLGIPVGSTLDQIAAAYRRRARDTHPDRLDDVTSDGLRAAGREFVRVTEARDVLWAYASGYRDDAGDPHEAPHSAVPMTFGEFLEWRKDAAWGPTPRSDPRADPVLPRADRWPGETPVRDAGAWIIRLFRRLRLTLARSSRS